VIQIPVRKATVSPIPGEGALIEDVVYTSFNLYPEIITLNYFGDQPQTEGVMAADVRTVRQSGQMHQYVLK